MAAALSFLAYARIQTSRLDKVSVQLSLTKEEIVGLKQSLAKQTKISDVTEDIVTNAVVKTAEIVQVTKSINGKVDKTAEEVKDGKINNSIATAAYVDSMWDAYCEASPYSTAKRCTTR